MKYSIKGDTITNKATNEKITVVTRTVLPCVASDFIVGGLLVAAGFIYVGYSSFIHGINSYSRAEWQALDSVHLVDPPLHGAYPLE